MSERTILLHPHEVTGILERGQTVLKRPAKAIQDLSCDIAEVKMSQENTSILVTTKGGALKHDLDIRSPFGQPGDVLVGKETWFFDSRAKPGYGIHYRANACVEYEEWFLEMGWKWRSPVHMPRWAVRIVRSIKRECVARVQDITEADAKTEGARFRTWYQPHGGTEDDQRDISGLPGYPDERASWRNGFATIWDAIYAKRGFGWDANPWVWVVEFEKENE